MTGRRKNNMQVQVLERLIDAYQDRLISAMQAVDKQQIIDIIMVLKKAWEQRKNIFLIGNGGSAATASHIACDLNKGVSFGLENRLKVLALNESIPILLALGNDVNFESVFVEQLKNFLEPGDVVIALSGSGNSPNILEAIDYAQKNGAITIGLCGYDGGRLRAMVQHPLHVPVDDQQVAEDIHLIIGHIIMRSLVQFLVD